jgi:hypothetical protein
VSTIGTDTTNQLAAIFVSSQNTDWSLALCYISAALVGVMGLVAVGYNLRQATIQHPRHRKEEER